MKRYLQVKALRRSGIKDVGIGDVIVHKDGNVTKRIWVDQCEAGSKEHGQKVKDYNLQKAVDYAINTM